MSVIIHGIIHGKTIELDHAPALPAGQTVAVTVTATLPQWEIAATGPSMASALAAIAAAGGPSGFDDPVEWQRQFRADRALPGRTD